MVFDSYHNRVVVGTNVQTILVELVVIPIATLLRLRRGRKMCVYEVHIKVLLALIIHGLLRREGEDMRT